MPGLFDRIRATSELVKLPHTVFALPFAFLAAFIAAHGPPTLYTTGYILLAMVGARTGAMAVNRLADRTIDARNPRTRERALATGQLGVGYVTVLAVISFVLVVFAAWRLNTLALGLAPVAIAILCFYSFAKRFTWLSHVFLGLALAGAPIGAWIAVTGAIAWPPMILGLAVLSWVAGFDIIYACQDVEFDRKAGLHSIPARFGIERALAISSGLHALMIALLLPLPFLAPLGPLFLSGVIIIGILLFYEHRLVGPANLSKLNEAFFTMNGLVSVVLFVFGALDIALFA